MPHTTFFFHSIWWSQIDLTLYKQNAFERINSLNVQMRAQINEIHICMNTLFNDVHSTFSRETSKIWSRQKQTHNKLCFSRCACVCVCVHDGKLWNPIIFHSIRLKKGISICFYSHLWWDISEQKSDKSEQSNAINCVHHQANMRSHLMCSILKRMPACASHFQ